MGGSPAAGVAEFRVISRVMIADFMRCRACKSVNFVRARLQWWEFVLLLFLSRPFRCDGCLARFYGFVWCRSRPRDAMDKKEPAPRPVRPGTATESPRRLTL